MLVAKTKGPVRIGTSPGPLATHYKRRRGGLRGKGSACAATGLRRRLFVSVSNSSLRLAVDKKAGCDARPSLTHLAHPR